MVNALEFLRTWPWNFQWEFLRNRPSKECKKLGYCTPLMQLLCLTVHLSVVETLRSSNCNFFFLKQQPFLQHPHTAWKWRWRSTKGVRKYQSLGYATPVPAQKRQRIATNVNDTHCVLFPQCKPFRACTRPAGKGLWLTRIHREKLYPSRLRASRTVSQPFPQRF